MVRQPKVLSAMGLAASICLVALLGIPWWTAPAVRAATIIDKLNRQMSGGSLIEITIESLTIDAASVDGWLQIADTGLAGDLAVSVVGDGDDPHVDVDLALGITDGGGWLLLRRLKVDEPQAQAVIDTFLMSKGDVLLQLPQDMLDGDFGIGEELKELQTGKVAEVFQKMIDAPGDTPAQIETQPDGSILLTIPIADAAAVRSLKEWASDMGLQDVEAHAHGTAEGHHEHDGDNHHVHHEHHREVIRNVGVAIHGESDDDDELIGATIRIVYDPATESVRSVSVDDMGEVGSRIHVAIRQGAINPALLDAARVTTPTTAILDLGALEALFHGAMGEDD